MKNITIYDIGVNQAHNSDTFYIDRPNGIERWLFLVVKSKAIFVLDKKEVVVEPNTAIFFRPNTPQLYYGIRGGENYCDHWMEFTMKEDVIKRMGIPTNTPIHGFDYPKIDSLCAFLLDEHFFGGKKSDMYIDMFMMSLLEKISEAVEEEKDSENDFKTLRKKVYQHPEWEWSVEKAAKDLNFSYSQFQYIYRKEFGSSFINDVIKSRVNHACKLLTETEYSISVISEMCGYKSDNYFVRQFKSEMGVTPLKYRGTNS